jgi:hypothetical protein
MKEILLLIFLASLGSCNSGDNPSEELAQSPSKIKVIIDTDANNEIDDQHALAYLLFNQDAFDIFGITVNATFNGGNIEKHYEEAERVLKLCDMEGDFPLLKGANASFEKIKANIDLARFDGSEAIDFIIEQAIKTKNEKLVLIPIGKLTNIALAVLKDPRIKEKIRIVWLGSNYPDPGEYNQDNDTLAMQFLLDQEVSFEMVTVRYGDPSGSDAVKVTPNDIKKHLSGKGPVVKPVEGRHGQSFTNFGDYAVNLFTKIDLHGDPPSRSLYDVVAVAIIKNPAWGEMKRIPAPELVNNNWEEQPNNPRKITVWENFNTTEILNDFYVSISESN